MNKKIFLRFANAVCDEFDKKMNQPEEISREDLLVLSAAFHGISHLMDNLGQATLFNLLENEISGKLKSASVVLSMFYDQIAHEIEE